MKTRAPGLVFDRMQRADHAGDRQIRSELKVQRAGPQASLRLFLPSLLVFPPNIVSTNRDRVCGESATVAKQKVL
jgi:hypothetical protein